MILTRTAHLAGDQAARRGGDTPDVEGQHKPVWVRAAPHHLGQQVRRQAARLPRAAVA
jgi:hypothetical protein